MSRRKINTVLATLAALLSAASLAEEGKAPLTVSASGSLRSGWWHSTRQLDDRLDVGTASVWLQVPAQLPLDTRLRFDGFVGNKDHTGARPDGKVREFYLETPFPFGYARVGRQIVSWGRADRLNPTDNLSPRNFTALTVEDDDQRYGTFATRFNIDVGTSGAMTLLWLPEYAPNILPTPAQPGVQLTEERPRDRDQYAVKFDHNGPLDWSVSYAVKRDLNPDLALQQANAQGVTVVARHHRMRIFGTDAAFSSGAYAFRGEAAYIRTEDMSGVDPTVKNPYAYAVVGGERSFADSLSVIVQLYGRRVRQYNDPKEISDPVLRTVAIQQAIANQELDRHQYGASLRVAKKWLNDTVEAEVAAIYVFKRDDYGLRPKFGYAINDHAKFTFGADIFRGSSDSYYGRLRKNSGAYTEFRYAF